MDPYPLAALLAVAGLLGCSGGTSVEQPAADPDPPWPPWAFTHWVWEDESTQASASALIDDYLARDIPVGAIIIDSPWETGYNTFVWDPARFPDPQGMIDRFHDQDVRVLLWTVSAINLEQTELYDYAAERDYFLLTYNQTGPGVVDWWKGEGSLLDYFNPDAVQWWHGLVDQALAYGIDGWKTDGLDFYALFAPYSKGAGRKVTRPEYSEAYYRDFFDYTRARLGKDRLLMARPVDNYGTGIGGADVAFAPRDINWVGWVGDQDASFSGLERALNNMYHSSLLGYATFGSDIGGYRENADFPAGRSKELFIRWAQLGALCPVMENGGGGEHRPWAFDLETTDIYRRFVRLHYALLPYLTTEGARAFADGISLMQFFEAVEYRYLLGPDLFVVPILAAGTTKTVLFPNEGTWRYLFAPTEEHSAGSTVEIEIPLSEFPVFVRAGSELADTLEVPPL